MFIDGFIVAIELLVLSCSLCDIGIEFVDDIVESFEYSIYIGFVGFGFFEPSEALVNLGIQFCYRCVYSI